MLFFFLFSRVSSLQKRKFPFYPVLKPNCVNDSPCIVNFFSFLTLNKKSSSYPVFQKCIKAFENRRNTSHCLTRLHSYAIEHNGDAAFTLGTIYEFGLYGNQQNDTLARYYYKLGANAGHADSQYSLSFMQRYGFGGIKDVEASLVTLKSAVLGNSIPAILADSFMYIYGLNHPKSYHAAFEKLQPILGIMMNNLTANRRKMNYGVTRLKREFINKFRENEIKFKAIAQEAKSGNLGAMIVHATNLLFGHYYGLCEANVTAATELLLKAADNGVVNANQFLGLKYLYGLGEKVDLGLAELYFRKAVQGGHTGAMYELALLYLQNKEKNDKYDEAMEMLHLSQLNYCPAFYKASFFQSKELITLYHQRCLRDDFLEAIYYDGLFNYHGFYNKSDPKMGTKRLFLAAELSPLFDIAGPAWIAYMNDDWNFSLRLYQKIADWGSEAAMFNVGKILDDMKQDKSDWSDMLLKMKFTGAYIEKSKNEMAAGNETEGLMYLKKASENSGRAAYLYAVKIHQTAKNESLAKLKFALSRKKSALIAVWFYRLKIYFESIPIGLVHFIREKKTQERTIFLEFLLEHYNTLSLIFIFSVFSIMLRIRLKTVLVD